MFGFLFALLTLICPGDANGDNQVNILDLSVQAAHYWQTVEPGTNGDVNRDGTVNMLDLVLTASHYQSVCIPIPQLATD